VAIVLGVLVSVQYQIQQQINVSRDIAKERNIAMIEVLRRAETEKSLYEEEIQSLRHVISIYERIASENRIITPGISEELDRLRLLTGKTQVTGSGIIITMDDREDADPLSSSDLQDLVNILRYAGAEAISINGQRIVANSPISEAGSNMLINKTPIKRLEGTAYEVIAIGDSERLERMIRITDNFIPGLTDYRGIKVVISKEEVVIIPALLGGVVFEYAQPIQ
jgi:uncharacterized protein YlxW (UPF0749 family)